MPFSVTASRLDEPRAAREHVLHLVKRFGFNSTSFQILEPSYRYWFDGADACVAYFDTGRAWIGAGAPIASKERLQHAAQGFARAAARAGKRGAFFGIERRFAQNSSLPTLKIGEQPVWDPQRWEASSRKQHNLQAQLRRARAKGVVVRSVAPAELLQHGSDLRPQLLALAQRWSATRKLAPMGFLVCLELFGFAEERRYFVAERAGQCIGLLVAVPIYQRAGWLFEDLLRDALAPNGTNELLVDFAMRSVAAAGSQFVTLGLVPLCGVEGVLGYLREPTRPLYDFRGLRTFKEKFGPHTWEPVFLAHDAATAPLLAVHDALLAFAQGSFAKFAAKTLQRRLHQATLGRVQRVNLAF